MTQQLHFYDASNSRNVPSGVHAAVYINGNFAWPESEIKRMAKVFRISVFGHGDAWRHARCVDIESGDATPESALPFLIERTKHFGDATAYCNRSTRPQVQQLCERAGILHAVRFWIATLDGTQNVPGAWAVQYAGGLHAAVDVSVLHGVDDFRVP
jgi:hypothetical protein